MSTNREIIAKVRKSVQEKNADSTFTNKYFYSKITYILLSNNKFYFEKIYKKNHSKVALIIKLISIITNKH